MNTSSMIRMVISSLLMAIFSQTCPAQVAVEIKGTIGFTLHPAILRV